MSKEILLVANSVSNEKGVPSEIIFEAIESALVTATKRKYKTIVNIRVAIDRKTGAYETFRFWNVVSKEEYEADTIHLLPQEAKKKDPSLKIGDIWEEQIESIDFGRIAAQTAKQVIVQKIREAERHQMIEAHRRYLNELVTGTVKKKTRDFYLIDLGNNAEAMLRKADIIPREIFRTGSRVRALLQKIEEDQRGSHLILSRTCKEMLIELFRLEVPEIKEEVIEIKAAARDPGSRAKIAVKTNDGRIDPVGACVGMRGSRVQAISNELQNERVDIVLWDEDPAQFVINAMQPAEVASIVIDENKVTMDIAIAENNLAQAIGRGGQNVRLASELTGWTLNVMTEEEIQKKQENESHTQLTTLTQSLEISEKIAQQLIEADITTIEEVAYVSEDEIIHLCQLSQTEVADIQKKAKDVLLLQEMIGNKNEEDTNTPVKETALSHLAIDDTLIAELKKHGITSLEILADKATHELEEIKMLSEKNAGELIMQARNLCWFSEND